MTDINTLTLVGRVVRDAELRTSKGGLDYSNLSIAVNKSVKNGDSWSDSVSFFDICLFGSTAKNLYSKLTKGTQVVVSGSLEQRTVEIEGQKIKKININVDRLQILNKSEKVENQESSPRKQFLDIKNAKSSNSSNNESVINYDDIPF